MSSNGMNYSVIPKIEANDKRRERETLAIETIPQGGPKYKELLKLFMQHFLNEERCQ